VTDEIQTFFAFVVGKGLRAQRLPVKVGKETMVGKTVNALCPIDSSGGKVFVEDEYWTATSDTLVKIAVEGLTTKVKPET
jgi:membrane-bound serine protease (ClpP class)